MSKATSLNFGQKETSRGKRARLSSCECRNRLPCSPSLCWPGLPVAFTCGLVPLQARPVWDMGMTHVEGGKSYSLQPGLGRGSMLVGSQALTFEPVVRVALTLAILIWKRNSRSARLLSPCPTANAACARPQLCSVRMNLDLGSGGPVARH